MDSVLRRRTTGGIDIAITDAVTIGVGGGGIGGGGGITVIDQVRAASAALSVIRR